MSSMRIHPAIMKLAKADAAQQLASRATAAPATAEAAPGKGLGFRV